MGSIALTLAVLYAISAIVGYLQSFTVATVTQRFSQRFRTAIQKKINSVPLIILTVILKGTPSLVWLMTLTFWDNLLVKVWVP